MSTHQTAVQWLGDNWVWIIIWVWVLGGFGWAADHYRRVVNARREAAEIRHQRAVEIELARKGIPPAAGKAGRDPRLSLLAGRWAEAVKSGRPAIVTAPAAVIPSPPGAQPVHGVPGECRHERIVPVIGNAGELHRWVCANYPRCDAEFDKSVAIYEPAGEES